MSDIINPNNEPFLGTPRIQYMFRSECMHDCDIVRIALRAWIVNWEEEPNYLSAPEGLREVPDRLVRMSLRTDQFTSNLNQLRWVLSQFDDLHVIVQTLKLASEYTGERDFHTDFGAVNEENVPDNATLSTILLNFKDLVIVINDIAHGLTQASVSISDAWNQLGKKPKKKRK